MKKMKKKLIPLLLACLIIYMIFFKTDLKYSQNIQFISNFSSNLAHGHFKTIKEKDIFVTKNNFIRPNEEFYLNPENQICGNSLTIITFVIVVMVGPQNVEKRNLIRLTYGNKHVNSEIRVLFVVGMSENNDVNKLIIEEFATYKDIIQINNYVDSINNSTLKTFMSFHWVSKFCKNSKFILRVNDEVFINAYGLIHHFKSLKAERKLFGNGIYGASPNRDIRSKFYVSENEYSKSQYSDFVEGNFRVF